FVSNGGGGDSRDAVFESFYTKYYDRVYWYVFKRLNHIEESQDLTADIFCACYKYFDSYDPEKSSVGTWLYVIVNNKLKNYYRAKKSDISLDAFYENILQETDKFTTGDAICDAVYLDDCRSVLSSAITELPERNQMVLILKFFGGKQSEEIAKIMNISPVNVRVIITRSLKKIGSYMAKKGWGSGD
ncbi:MAG: sigma-70 family RNA polymerase sigma factor, partial [Clostridiales bacterium]|nr:sigma-70 family RNA polymerase sigma factor [Clostridiales bacterium]